MTDHVHQSPDTKGYACENGEEDNDDDGDDVVSLHHDDVGINVMVVVVRMWAGVSEDGNAPRGGSSFDVAYIFFFL